MVQSNIVTSCYLREFRETISTWLVCENNINRQAVCRNLMAYNYAGDRPNLRGCTVYGVKNMFSSESSKNI